MAKMTGSSNHLIKQVAWGKKEVNRCDKEEHFLLQAEMEERADEVRMCNTTKEVTGKPTMGVEELLLVLKLMEVAGGKFVEDEATQEVVVENQSDFDQLKVYTMQQRSSVHNAMGVTPENLVFEQKICLLGLSLIHI